MSFATRWFVEAANKELKRRDAFGVEPGEGDFFPLPRPPRTCPYAARDHQGNAGHRSYPLMSFPPPVDQIISARSFPQAMAGFG